MGQCVSRKAGAAFAASSYKIMDKPTKKQNENKGTSKRGVPHTRGTSISFGFRRRSRGDNHNQSVANSPNDALPPRSKSLGPEQVRRRIIDEDDRHQRVQSASSGRSSLRLLPPKKEQTTGSSLRTNRFGFRQPSSRYTDKVTDIYTNQNAIVFNQNKTSDDIVPKSSLSSSSSRTNTSSSSQTNNSATKVRYSPVNQLCYNQTMTRTESPSRRSTGISEPVSKYTLQSSHLPQPQYAVRVNDANSKFAKTAVNQSRKVSTVSRGSAGSQSGSGTEDSGVSSQLGYPTMENETMRGIRRLDSSPRRSQSRSRNLRMVVNGKNFDVRDVDDESTVTEISVIPLPKSFAAVNLNTGLVRERTNQYQRIVNKDNRYAESVTSVSTISTTSSGGYDEGLGEEKVYKDRSKTEKLSSNKNDFSLQSSDDPEYGHGEAMADEYSFSLMDVDDCQDNSTTPQQLKIITNAAKNGSMQKNTLRSVLLTIEDPAFAFAAAAATSTTMIDDETSPVESLVDSLTASVSQSSKKERVVEKSGNRGNNDDDGGDESPGTPTNASNSLSLSEEREFFDDEIADQPGLFLDDNAKGYAQHSVRVSQAEHTRVGNPPKQHLIQENSIENSPINCRRINRMGSIGTLSPCESITSDDLMLDYEQSEASSYNETNRRLDSSPALHAMDDMTILSELEAQGEEVMREWSSLLGTQQQRESNANLANNNVNCSINNNNNLPANESGINSARTSRLLRNRPGTDSPRSQDSLRTRQIASPFRPVFGANGQSPNLDSGDEGSPRLERCNYHQDIVSIKTGLLKLMRVVQESGDNDLTRAETLNPFSNLTVNGVFQNLNDDFTTDTNIHLANGALNIADEMADLRRQVIFLQGQLDDKDRTIHHLQMQVAKQQELINNTGSQTCGLPVTSSSTKESCNAATQTEKIRPISAGPSLLQSLPGDGSMGPLVSWSDPWKSSTLMYQRPPSLVELSSSKNTRKTSDRLPVRIVKTRQDHGAVRLNGDADKPLSDISVRKLSKSRELTQCKNDIDHKKDDQAKRLSSLKKFNTQTFIPRVMRSDVSLSGLHNNSS